MTGAGAGADRLRLLIVRDPGVPLRDWQARVLDRLGAQDHTRIVGVVTGQGPATVPRPPAMMRAVLGAEGKVVRRSYARYDCSGTEAMLDALPEVKTNTKVDVALRLGHHELTAQQLAQCDHGEWSLAFGGAPVAAWALTRPEQCAAPYVPVQLLIRSAEAPDARVLRAADYNHKPGAVLTGAFVEEKSVLLILRALRDLAEGHHLPVSDDPVLDAGPPPTFGETIAYASDFARKVIAKVRQNRQTKQGKAPDYWQLALGAGPVTGCDPARAKALPAHSHTMADPFLFTHNGTTWVFYEAMNADNADGWIDAAPLEGDTLGPPVTALRCPYHLSFPYVFRAGDDIYMLPETNQSKRLEVWRATDFPGAWTLHATAFEGMHLADSTLWQAPEGQWWLLTNQSDHHAFQDHSSELYLYAVDGPGLGNIVAHPGNPVVIGAGNARNAGALIQHDGRLYRPTQNNAHGVYGFGLNLMEVTRLDMEHFEERQIRGWTPADRPGIAGIHHLSAADGHYVFDWSGT